MPYTVLEKEIERLDETQKNAVVMFVRFLLSQNPSVASVHRYCHHGYLHGCGTEWLIYCSNTDGLKLLVFERRAHIFIFHPVPQILHPVLLPQAYGDTLV